MLAAGVRDKNRRGATGVGAGHKTLGKIHLGAKMAGEFRRRLLQFVILFARTDQHQLDLDIDRFRHQRHRRNRRKRHARLLDLQAAAAQEAPQLFPHQRIGQHVAQMQHQKPAVRLQQAAGADARKIGHQHVVLGLVFDAAEQRAEQRVVLDDHRRAGQAAVVHHQVDAVTRQHALQRFLLAFHRPSPLWNSSRLSNTSWAIASSQALSLAASLICFFKPGADRLHFALQQRLHHLPPQRRQRFVHRTLQRLGFFDVAGDLGTQFLLGPLHLGAAGFRQCQHLVLGQRLPLLADEGEHHAPLVAVQRKAARLGKRRQLGIVLCHFVLPGFLDALALDLVILSFQPLRNFALQGFHRLRQQLAQQPPLAGRQAQRQRPLRRIEVVEIAEIGRHPFARRHLRASPA